MHTMITQPTTQTDYYHAVPDAVLKPLLNFRADVPLDTTRIGNHTWTYYTLGAQDAPAVLLLHGGGGTAETMFEHITGLAENFFVIAPNIPATLTNITDTVTGLRALLATLDITKVHVVGISFGAMLAQMYIRRFMDTVHNLVITHSMIPSEHMAEPMRMQVNLLMLYPEPLLLWMSKRSYRTDLPQSSTASGGDTVAFWQAYFDEIYSEHITKRHIMSRAKITRNYHVEYEFNSRDLKGWQGQLLIIESENDQVINEGDRGSLKGMYSRAYIQTLYGYDHFAPLLAANEMVESITNFLLRFSEHQLDEASL